jgi:hypothetical protein
MLIGIIKPHQRFPMPSRHPKSLHPGCSPTELASIPDAIHFKSDVLPLAALVNDALLVGAQSRELFRDIKQARPLHMFEQRHA